jgi:TonB-dependent starch-binding outer membrane protein SusC
MRHPRKLWLVLLAFLLVPAAGDAQTTGTVTGRVLDEGSGEPVIGAQIFLAGTSRGMTTNQEGRFIMVGVPAGTYELRATVIGYAQESREITVTAGETTAVDITLRQSAIELGAVVVTASGQEQRTRELGNSVATIRTSDVSSGPVNSVTTLLQSRAPGVTVQQGSGSAGTAARFRIRGSNSVSLSNEPLVIVDGVRVNVGDTDLLSVGGQYASRLNDFNVEQIESI